MITISVEEYTLLKKQLIEKDAQIAKKEFLLAEQESQIAEQKVNWKKNLYQQMRNCVWQ